MSTSVNLQHSSAHPQPLQKKAEELGLSGIEDDNDFFHTDPDSLQSLIRFRFLHFPLFFLPFLFRDVIRSNHFSRHCYVERENYRIR